MSRPLPLLLLLAACGADPAEDLAARGERLKEGYLLAGDLTSRSKFERVVALGEPEPLVEVGLASSSPRAAGAALVALAAIGGPEAERAVGQRLPGMYAQLAQRVLEGEDVDVHAELARLHARLERRARAAELVARVRTREDLEPLVALGEVGPVLAFSKAQPPGRKRNLASVALGAVGGPGARDRLLELLAEDTGDKAKDGPTHLYAAAGLTLLRDPGTAIDLLLNLSRINPDDHLAARAAEGATGAYWTIDAQICDALLAMGLWEAEEELVEQMRRRAYVRVLIDAHACLRRHTGLDLPFRYNGSYADRNADADAWIDKLRATREAREQRRPFDATDPRFRTRCDDMIAWLGGTSVNYRYIAEKVVVRLGPYALPFLREALESDNPVAQREAALVMGRIGRREAAPALRAALKLADADARATAIDALRKLGDTAAAPLVQARLGDADAEVRAAAASFLGALGGTVDRAALEKTLANETSPGTVTSILCALLRLGDGSVTPRLGEIFVEGEQPDRVAAHAALARAFPDWEADPAATRGEREKAAERLR